MSDTWGAKGDPGSDPVERARALRASGQPVVGIVGASVPPELVLAAGAVPLLLSARSQDAMQCPPFMELQHGLELRSLFHQAVSGELAFCDALVVAGTSDNGRHLYQYLTELRRQGRADMFPPVLLFDLLYGSADGIADYAVQATKRLAHELAIALAQDPALPGLAAAMAGMRGLRSRMRDLNALRSDGRLSGVEYWHCAQWVRLLQLDSCAAKITAVATAAQARTPPASARPRLLLIPASSLHHSTLHGLVDQAGATIVDEDDEAGSRCFAADVGQGADAWLALADYSRIHAPAPRMLTRERESWMLARMASGAVDGVLFYIPGQDSHFGWRYPALRAAAQSAGLPQLLVDEDVLAEGSHGRVAARIASFMATMSRGVH